MKYIKSTHTRLTKTHTHTRIHAPPQILVRRLCRRLSLNCPIPIPYLFVFSSLFSVSLFLFSLFYISKEIYVYLFASASRSLLLPYLFPSLPPPPPPLVVFFLHMYWVLSWLVVVTSLFSFYVLLSKYISMYVYASNKCTVISFLPRSLFLPLSLSFSSAATGLVPGGKT